MSSAETVKSLAIQYIKTVLPDYSVEVPLSLSKIQVETFIRDLTKYVLLSLNVSSVTILFAMSKTLLYIAPVSIVSNKFSLYECHGSILESYVVNIEVSYASVRIAVDSNVTIDKSIIYTLSLIDKVKRVTGYF